MFNLQSFGLGFVSGLATGIVARELTAVTGTALKPLARGIVKTGYLAVDKVKETFALASEAIEDIAAEVRAEAAQAKEEAALMEGEEATRAQEAQG